MSARTARTALVELSRLLRERGYTFTPATPLTHARVVGRDPGRSARDARDVLGWSRPFERGLDVAIEDLLCEADAVDDLPDGRWRSRLRCASLPSSSEVPALYFHSAWPTDDKDAVFFGPDTVRYAALARRWLLDRSELGPDAGPKPLGRVVDVGAGSGAGALSLAPWATRVVLADINPAALELSRTNAEAAGLFGARDDPADTADTADTAEVVESDVLSGVGGDIDVVISNPPYLVDPAARAYRHGGDRGIELPLRIVREGLARLGSGGRLLVYTGSPVVDGRNLFLDAAHALVAQHHRDRRADRHALVRAEELDPDVFGETLDEPAYADVERIALVGLMVTLR